MAEQNRWQVGVMYYGGRSASGLPMFTQPDGPGTPVQPREIQGAVWPEWPAAGEVVFGYSPWFYPGCGHAIQMWSLIREFNYDTGLSVCLIACKTCSYVQSYVSPYEEILNPIERAIIIG